MSEVVKVNKLLGVSFGIIFLLVGIGIVGYYVKTEINKAMPDDIYERTKAEVIGYEYNKNGQAAVVVEYVVNQQSYTMISNCYSSKPEKLGKEMKVQYDVRYPRKAVLLSSDNDIIFLVVGMLFIIASSFVIWYASKENEKEVDWVVYRGSIC